MLKYLIEKEFKQIFRDSFMPKIIIGFPLMVMLVMPWALTMDLKNVKVSLVDNDHSPYSTRLVEKIRHSGYFQLTNISGTYVNALRSVESGNADLILAIPYGFQKNLAQGNTSQVMIAANSINNTKGGLGSAYLVSILNDFSNEIRSDWVQASQKGNLPTIEISTQNRFNPHLNYKVFMIPALMGMLLTMLCGFLPALNIVSEKEKGTIEQINVTPVSKFTFIMGKLIPYWIIGFIVLTLCFTLAALIYGLIPQSYITIYLFAAIYILLVSGIGLVISNYSATMQQAMFVMFFFLIVFILISGLFTPISSMPQWAQVVTYFNPLRYFMEAMRMVFLKGSGIIQLLPQLLALIGFAVAFNFWAVLSYKKKGA